MGAAISHAFGIDGSRQVALAFVEGIERAGVSSGTAVRQKVLDGASERGQAAR